MTIINEKFDNFFTIYSEELRLVHQEHPDEYFWPESQMDDVLARMRKAILQGTYNKDGFAFRRTCKRLGIKHTYKAISAYLKGE